MNAFVLLLMAMGAPDCRQLQNLQGQSFSLLLNAMTADRYQWPMSSSVRTSVHMPPPASTAEPAGTVTPEEHEELRRAIERFTYETRARMVWDDATGLLVPDVTPVNAQVLRARK